MEENGEAVSDISESGQIFSGMPKEWQGYEGASLFFNVQSQVVYHMTDVWFKQLTDFGMFGQVKDWRFFMWLDKYLDMVEEIWMINVLIMGNASARRVSREMQRRIDATRAENDATRAQIDATRAQIDAIRVETAALDRRIEKLAAQNAKLQVLVYFLFVILLLVLLLKLVK